MAIQGNYFILALELGSSKMKDGVSCKETFNHLKDVNQITEAALPSFRAWFYNNGFFVPEYEEYLRRQDWDQIIRPDDIDNRFDTCKGFVRGEAYFKYLEYIEIREALKNSKNSSNYSNRCIGAKYNCRHNTDINFFNLVKCQLYGS